MSILNIQNRILLLSLLLGPGLLEVSNAFLNGQRHSYHHQDRSTNNVIHHHHADRIRIREQKSRIRMEAVSTQDNEQAVSTKNSSPQVGNKASEKSNGAQKRKQVNGQEQGNGQRSQSQSQQPAKKQHPPKKRDPWTAGFHVSKKTQQKIQQAAQDARGNRRRTPIARATAVLQTLLNMPFEKCNPANLVCALTLSAKVLGEGSPSQQNQIQKSLDQFRSLLFQVLDILHELVIDKKALNSRQLCNAIWAVAKHYDRDPLLLPLTPQMAAISVDQDGVAETWDLNDGGDDKDLSPAERVDATVQAIALQLTDVLTQEAELLAKSQKGDSDPARNKLPRETKLGEICMASWAFGVLRPRRRPPGWLAPPKMGQLPQFNNKPAEEPKRGNNFITFEQWTSSDSQDDLSFINTLTGIDAEPEDAADALFDAIGEALCRPLEANAFTNPSMYDPPFDLMRVSSCTWKEIANVAWAFEKRGRSLSTESEMLLRALAREASWRLREGGPETRGMLSRDISQLIWALGTLQQDNFRLAHDLVTLVDDFSEHSGSDDIQQTSSPFRDWSCPDIVQMILSLAHARIDEAGLLHALFEEAHLRLLDNGISTGSRFQSGRKSFLAWEVSVMLWAQARLFLTSPEGNVFEEFPETAAKCIQSTVSGGSLSDVGIGPQEQANIAWALTVLEKHQSDAAVSLLQGVFSDAANACESDGLIQLEHAHQLWQALFLLEEESPAAASKVPVWFRDYLSEKWDLEKSRKKISSARHKSISDVLNLMGVAHYNEHDEDIDVAIVLKRQASWAHQTDDGDSANAKRVAVEFDGPNHFTRLKVHRDGRPNKPVRALGHTVLKYRLLKKVGWTVIRVPYYEFDKIPFWASMVCYPIILFFSFVFFHSCIPLALHYLNLWSPFSHSFQERQRYLQRLLKTHANINFSEVDVSEYSVPSPNRKTRFD